MDAQRAIVPALEKAGPAAVPVLAEVLRDTERDARVQGAAIAALGKIGPAAVPTLMKLLQDKDASVRSAAAWALNGMHGEAKAAAAALAELLRDKDESVFYAADAALRSMGPAAIPPLRKLLDDKAPQVCRRAP